MPFGDFPEAGLTEIATWKLQGYESRNRDIGARRIGAHARDSEGWQPTRADLRHKQQNRQSGFAGRSMRGPEKLTCGPGTPLKPLFLVAPWLIGIWWSDRIRFAEVVGNVRRY